MPRRAISALVLSEVDTTPATGTRYAATNSAMNAIPTRTAHDSGPSFRGEPGRSDGGFATRHSCLSGPTR